VTEPTVRAATRATYVAFAGAGFAFAGWAARIPQVRDGLSLTPGVLGWVLLSVAAGSLVALVASGAIVARFGSRLTVQVMALLLGVGLLIVSFGFLVGLVPVVIGLFVLGFANGAWDVAMNVQGALVERRLGRSIMSRFHAGFSVGTVAGALVGAAMVALDVPVTPHLAIASTLDAVVVFVAVRAFLPDEVEEQHPDAPRRSPLAAWREPRTLLIGVFVLAFAFAEGTGNDWISIALIDGYGAPAAVGTLTFAVFLAAMTVGRWFGPGILDRYGRVPVVRAIAALAVVGLVMFVFGGITAVAVAGALLWGLGTSLGFPVGMSAAADEPALAPSRVSVVASIGYCAFLAGPPLIGFLGDQEGVLRALTVVAGLLAVAALVAGSLRPPSGTVLLSAGGSPAADRPADRPA
jgi:predicted MFS family arabinose efflux permease